MKTILSCICFFFTSSCFVKSYVKITDEFLEIKNDPNLSVIYEVKVSKFDSVLQYPTEEEIGPIYSVVERKSGKIAKGRPSIKIYFQKRNEKYYWRIWKNPPLLEYSYQDTIHLEPMIWYKIINKKQGHELYFLWKGKPGDFIIQTKPLPGPGPW
jgi:hypothetical protein